MDLDVTLESKKPATFTDKSSVDKRALFKTWEKSNRLSIMFMQMTIANNIKTTLPKIDTAVEFLTNVEERFKLLISPLQGH